MAAIPDTSQFTNGSQQATLTTPAFTVGSGLNRAIFVGITVDASSTVTSVEAAGLSTGAASLVLAGTAPLNNGRRAYIYYGVNPSSGSQTASCTFNNTDSFKQALGISTFTGVNQTTPVADYATDTNGGSPGTSPTINVANVAADDYLFDVLNHPSLTAPGANQGSGLWNISAAGSGGSIQDGADGSAMTWTTSEAQLYAYAAVRVVAAAEAPAALPFITQLGAKRI